MPKKVHEALKRQASKLGLTGERKKAYIFGTLSRIKKKGKNK